MDTLIVAAVLLLVRLLNIVVHFDQPAGYLPLIVPMPLSLAVAATSIREHRRR